LDSAEPSSLKLFFFMMLFWVVYFLLLYFGLGWVYFKWIGPEPKGDRDRQVWEGRARTAKRVLLTLAGLLVLIPLLLPLFLKLSQ
jgi:hypothetical protein